MIKRDGSLGIKLLKTPDSIISALLLGHNKTLTDCSSEKQIKEAKLLKRPVSLDVATHQAAVELPLTTIIHMFAVPMVDTTFEQACTALIGTPLNDGNLGVTCSPFSHVVQ